MRWIAPACRWRGSVPPSQRHDIDGLLDQPFYDCFAPLSGVTFRALAEETGIPVDRVMVVREAIGFLNTCLS
jgi:hypothetical protein